MASYGAKGRLIPAHAGSTQDSDKNAFTMQAHPRSRGEHGELVVVHDFSFGSSPLTRGAQYPRVPRPVPHRLIPAHAEST